MPDAFTAIDNLIREALTEFSGLTDLIPVGKIQLWDRDVDVRGEIETATDLGARLWILPRPGATQFDYGSGTTRFTRRYSIGFGIGGIRTERMNAVEWQVNKAMRRLFDGLKADGTTPITEPSPLTIEQVLLGDTDPEREARDDAEEWTNVCDVTVIAHAARSAL